MAGNAPVFPAFLKLEHQRDGSARSSFMAEVDSMLGDAENRFKRFGDTAAKFLDNAASFGRTSTGGLDIGAGKMREVAAAAEMRAKAAREIATATIAAARAEGDYSQQARLAIAAANAQAVAEEQAAKAARERAVAAGQLQAALDRQVHANDNLTQSIVRQNAAHGPISSSNDQMRAGLQQLAYQLNDVSTMAAPFSMWSVSKCRFRKMVRIAKLSCQRFPTDRIFRLGKPKGCKLPFRLFSIGVG